MKRLLPIIFSEEIFLSFKFIVYPTVTIHNKYIHHDKTPMPDHQNKKCSSRAILYNLRSAIKNFKYHFSQYPVHLLKSSLRISLI